MRLCRVLGSVTSTVKLECFRGLKLLVVEPMDETGKPSGKSFLAVDKVQAGEGDTVLVLSEGTGVRQLFGLPKTADLPIRSAIVAIVDQIDAPPLRT
ncbi:MAG TPA: EutN/CcmL family microcompartment protein [Myxococcales bacterium]|jgi:ethanolamine utilization protein EutN